MSFQKNVYGDISVFVNCPDLQTLDIGACNLSGSIDNLANLINLMRFSIAENTQITGSINSLANMINLTQLYLRYLPNITGDISVFRNLTRLEWLFVNNT